MKTLIRLVSTVIGLFLLALPLTGIILPGVISSDKIPLVAIIGIALCTVGISIIIIYFFSQKMLGCFTKTAPIQPKKTKKVKK